MDPRRAWRSFHYIEHISRGTGRRQRWWLRRINTAHRSYLSSRGVPAMIAGAALGVFCLGFPLGASSALAPWPLLTGQGLHGGQQPGLSAGQKAKAAASFAPAVRSSALPGSASMQKPARGKLLVATEQLLDPRFAHTVLLLLEYGPSGALGLITNRPSDHALMELFPRSPVPDSFREYKVFFGGPVELGQMLFLFRAGEKRSQARPVFADVQVSASRALIDQLSAEDLASLNVHFYAGYAGWGPGQLDNELERGDWLLLPARVQDVFPAKPQKVWGDLMKGRSGEWTKAQNAERCFNRKLVPAKRNKEIL